MLAEINSVLTTDKHTDIDFIVGPDPTIEAIQNQAEKPPGGDEYIGSFYQAFTDYLAVGNAQAESLITDVQTERQITPALHTNLLFRAIQAELISSPDYPQAYKTRTDWTLHLNRIFQSPETVDRIKRSLIEKDTTTTVYQRYLGEFAFAEHLAEGKGVKLIDLGCGGNYGVPGMQIGESFQKIIDNTPGEFINGKLSKRLKIKEGWALDRENPYTPESIAWRHSCGHYPSELAKGGLNETLALEQRLTEANSIFHQENLLSISDAIPRGYFDFAFINTMLYQLPSDLQSQVISNGRDLLTDEGWLFIQDFAIPDPNDPTKLIFDGVEWGVKGNYRLFVTANGFGDRIYEILRWNNGRCKEATPGADFEIVSHLFR